MKCPVCVREGERSIVYPDSGSFVTAMPVHRWYGEDGEEHYHDPNVHGLGYRCSLGHRWATSWVVKCPAGDYGGEATTRELTAMVQVPVPVYVQGPDGEFVLGEPMMEWRVPESVE